MTGRLELSIESKKRNSSARRGPKPKPGPRDNLLEAGLQLIHANGYAATGLQGIVEAAAVPKGSFYSYFASKEAFGTAVIDAYSERGLADLREYLCNPEIAPLVRLRGWFDHRIEALTASDYARGCLLGNFSAEAADHSASIREHVAHEFSAWSSVIADCLSEAQRQGAIGNQFPSALLADFILTSWEGALLRMRAEKSVAPLVDFKTFIFAKSLG